MLQIDAKRMRSFLRRKPGPIQKYVHDQLIKLWKHSVLAFLEEVSQNISVDTGMSLATLLPLARSVRGGQIILSELSGASGSKKGYNPKYGFAKGTGNKSISQGQRFGKDAYNLEFGTPKRPVFRFHFEIVVLQYYLHEEQHTMNYHSQTWQTLRKGRKAFIDYFESNFDRYVTAQTILNYFSTGKVVYGVESSIEY